MNIVLETNNIDVFYGNLQALWNLSFKVGEGEKVVIIGSNGAGKTTALMAIAGLLRSKSGSIKFYDKNIDKIHPHKIVQLGLSLVPEGRRLFSNMTVSENLKMGAYSHEAWKRKDETLELIFRLFPILKTRISQLAGTLSGGEQQMLAIARGLMAKPKLLMLDEPSLGLAPKLVLTMFDMINEINKEGVTILLTEQNAVRALQIADKAYVLENGKMALEGKGEELLKNSYVKKAYLGL